MKCPKCNTQLSDNSYYCKTCGKELNNNHDSQFYYSEYYSNIYKQTITSDEDYIRKYIGKTYDDVKKENFSLNAFILGPFYLLIKKIYTPAVIVLLITIVLFSYNQDISSIFYIVISAYIGLKGTSMYLQHAIRKVEEIKISNPDKSSTEILEICEKKGNNNIQILLLILSITIVINIIFIYLIN